MEVRRILKNVVCLGLIIVGANSCNLNEEQKRNKVHDWVETRVIDKDTIDVYYELDSNQNQSSLKQKQIIERIAMRINKDWSDSIQLNLFNYYAKNRKKFIDKYVFDKNMKVDSAELQKLFPKPESVKFIQGKYKLRSISISADSKYQGVHFILAYDFLYNDRKLTAVEFDGWKIINVY